MSTNKFLPKLQEIQKREGNKKCIDCNSPNPQWASVPFGILFCLECSGKHRALGVHIRSITMDKWSEQQVKKMDLGGNSRALEYFKESSDFSEDMTIEEKYTSQFAQNYREKLAAECDGKAWTPSASTEASSRNSTVHSPLGPKRSSTLGVTSGIQRTSSAESNASRNSTRGQGRRSQTNKSSTGTPKRMESGTASPRGGNEEYFAKLGEANDSRRDDVPPNQGGKYTGFGNTPDATSSPATPGIPDIGDLLVDPLGTLSKGWSLFSLGASSALGQAAEGARNLNTSVLQPATERIAETVRDPELQGRVSGYVSSFSRTVQDTGSKGFSYLSEYLQPNTQTYGQVGHDEDNEDFDENYSSTEKFEPYRDTPDEHEEEEPEQDAWKSVDHPVSGSTSSTRLGSSSMSLANSRGSDSMQLRRNKNKGAPKKKVDDSWGDENDEWSKF